MYPPTSGYVLFNYSYAWTNKYGRGKIENMMLNTRRNSESRGFTLIELLVVIAIIALLSSIVLASLSSARIKSRDARRKADLHQIMTAMELYYDSKGTFAIPNSGWWDTVTGTYATNSSGSGFFAYEDASPYQRSIARALKEEGLLGALIKDPSGITNGTYAYMLYPSGDGQHFAVYARLENPSVLDIAQSQNLQSWTFVSTNYGMNYGVGE